MTRPRCARSIVGCLLATILSVAAGSAAATEPDWQDYDALLQDYVAPGTRAGVQLNQVDYAGLAADPAFARVIRDLEAFDLAQLEPGAETIAFYINAYNILALRMVTEHLPLESIRDVGSFFSPVWKRDAGSLGGETVSLDEVEHERLRRLGEPRIHLAIVCASISCPDLRTEAYRAADLDRQLDEQARAFFANRGKGLRLSGSQVALSRIFKWFDEDFADAGGVLAFAARYHELPDDAEVDEWIDYDWSLNTQ